MPLDTPTYTQKDLEEYRQGRVGETVDYDTETDIVYSESDYREVYKELGVDYREPREEPGEAGTVPPEHREFAIKHPNTYAAGQVFWNAWDEVRKYAAPLLPGSQAREDTVRLIDSVGRSIPFLRLTNPQEWDEFWYKTSEEQTWSLTGDALELALLSPGGAGAAWGMIKGTAKAPFKLYKALRPGFKMKPVEELALEGVRSFYYEEQLLNKLKKMGIKNKEELTAVMTDDLPYFYATQMGKKKAISPELGKIVEFVEHKPQLLENVKAALSPAQMRRDFYAQEFSRVAREIGGKDVGKGFTDKVFDAFLKKNTPEMVGKVTLKDATTPQLANFLDDMLRHPKTAYNVREAGVYLKIIPDLLSPVRVAFGRMEKKFGAFSKIYRPISKALERRNKYATQKLLVYKKMLTQRGLGKLEAKATGEIKFIPAATEEEFQAAYQAGQKIDEITALRKKVPMMSEELKNRVIQIQDSLSPNARKILQTTRDFNDHLYAEHMKIKIHQLFDNLGYTKRGAVRMSQLMSEVDTAVHRIFSKAGNFKDYDTRNSAIKGVLAQLRKVLAHPDIKKTGLHPYFKAKGKNLKKLLQDLDQELRLGENGRFINYRENYMARIGKRHMDRAAGWDKQLVGEMHAGYTHARREISGAGVVGSFESALQGRIRMQANELFMFPEISEAVNFASKLPKNIRKYTDHYLARILGRTSDADAWLAGFLNNTISKFSPKIWTAERIDNLAMSLNNLGLLGGLAFKPFSAMRNLFQPLITVPADLGGLKGFVDLLKGMRKSLDPNFRKYIRDIGAIQEYAPELYLKERLLPWGKGAKMERLRDVGMWMFSGSDRLSRYMAGGAALSRWESAWVASNMGKRVSQKTLDQFYKKLGLKGRYPWMQEEIKELCELGSFGEAKAKYLNDVIADTQYLYRVGESPLIAQKGGFFGKTGALFQSWWMNYGTLLEKWMHTGEASTKTVRMFNWMLSSAIAMSCMEQMWGTKSALRDTFLGPFPTTINRYLLPPAWTPIYDTVNLVANLPNDLIQGEPEKLAKRAKALFKSVSFFAPGSLQFQAMARGAMEEEEGAGVGLAKSIIRFHRDQDFEPWYKGMVD